MADGLSVRKLLEKSVEIPMSQDALAIYTRVLTTSQSTGAGNCQETRVRICSEAAFKILKLEVMRLNKKGALESLTFDAVKVLNKEIEPKFLSQRDEV